MFGLADTVAILQKPVSKIRIRVFQAGSSWEPISDNQSYHFAQALLPL